jgi:hypothetical protein
VTEDPSPGLLPPTEADRQAPPPGGQLIERIFAVALAGLLAGYMFLGRGFAHVGIGPVYVGDVVLFLGAATVAVAAMRGRVSARTTWTIGLIVAFMVLGAVRTLPYLGVYGLDALRDGVLWGYGAFALIVYALADRVAVLTAFRLYGWVVPAFAVWLPISWNLFATSAIDPAQPGSFIPLVFFKGGDMAVHTVGAIAFLVLGASSIRSARTFVWRMLIGLPLLWTVLVAGTSNRGALLTAFVGIVVVAMLAGRSRNWLPLLAATGMFAIAVIVEGLLAGAALSAPASTAQPSPIASGSIRSSPAGQPQLGTPLMVANAGFELGPVNNGTIEGWTIRAAGPHNIVEGGAYRGARYASVQNVAGKYEDTITSSRITFSGGPDIGVSVWVKAIAARPILEIYVYWYDNSGALISRVPLKRLLTDGVGDWQEGAGAAVAPAKAAEAEVVFFEAAGHATMGLDEVSVRSGDLIPKPVPPKGRPATFQQMIDNLLSIFGSSANGGLEGSKQFRLAWWGKIVDYTVFGNYFWTGKGFGVNLADADGFQSTADHSLRSPHNSEMTVLARMGVPGLGLWLLLQGVFVVGLLRALVALRRAGDVELAAVAGWILAYWVAMSVDTSFDPYLEGPQGGIWFWAIFGLGLVIMSLVPRRRVTA